MVDRPVARLELDPESRCTPCGLLAAPHPQPRQCVARTDAFSVAHSFNTSLEGWLVVLPRRHVVRVADLDDAEARELGPLLCAVSAALAAVVGCEKTYVIQLAEAPGFNHVHFHVVPRRADLPEELTGVRVFGMLGDGVEPVPEPRQDAICLEVRKLLVAGGVASAPRA